MDVFLYQAKECVGIFSWTYASTDEEYILINFWLEEDGSGAMNVTFQLDLGCTYMFLHYVNIVLTLGI